MFATNTTLELVNLTKFNNILGKNFFKKKINFQNSPSLEAQIASISDDIAYNSHDLEDGLRAQLFKLKDLKNLPVLNSILKRHDRKFKKFLLFFSKTYKEWKIH